MAVSTRDPTDQPGQIERFIMDLLSGLDADTLAGLIGPGPLGAAGKLGPLLGTVGGRRGGPQRPGFGRSAKPPKREFGPKRGISETQDRELSNVVESLAKGPVKDIPKLKPITKRAREFTAPELGGPKGPKSGKKVSPIRPPKKLSKAEQSIEDRGLGDFKRFLDKDLEKAIRKIFRDRFDLNESVKADRLRLDKLVEQYRVDPESIL